ncbi:hypothetical protein [Pontibacter sp. H249]|uniref:hypothetical protein n=1 Tax=Pontibacter sp. H249 TaxID=3133420 RepID=UPI0030C429DC
MKYLLKYSTSLLLLLLVLSSCRKEPSYPDTPEIEFLRVETEYRKEVNDSNQETGITTAILTMIVGYQDGNGDLGLRPLDNTPNTSDPDSQAPFQPGSIYENNFIAELFIKRPVPGNPTDSAFVKYELPVAGFDFSGRFRRLTSDDRTEPLEGEIRYTLSSITSEFFKPGDIIKFQIYIYDRNLPVPNRSNIVETTPIKLTF